jgi:hypothetical protein
LPIQAGLDQGTQTEMGLYAPLSLMVGLGKMVIPSLLYLTSTRHGQCVISIYRSLDAGLGVNMPNILTRGF